MKRLLCSLFIFISGFLAGAVYVIVMDARTPPSFSAPQA